MAAQPPAEHDSNQESSNNRVNTMDYSLLAAIGVGIEQLVMSHYHSSKYFELGKSIKHNKQLYRQILADIRASHCRLTIP